MAGSSQITAAKIGAAGAIIAALIGAVTVVITQTGDGPATPARSDQHQPASTATSPPPVRAPSSPPAIAPSPVPQPPPSLGQFVGSVVSSAGPSPGQQNRSSHNFSTTGAKGSHLLWRVLVNNVEDASISFNVMEDIRLGQDPTHLSGLDSGTTTPVIHNGSLYIANPRGAQGEFTVKIYAQ